MDILYSAYVGSTSSWSIVARNVISNLLLLGNKIRVSSTNGWENVPPEIVSLASTQLTDPVFLGYTVPHRLPSISQKTKFLIYNYESSLLPSGWAATINQQTSLVFPASTYTANILRNNGVISDKIVVMPYGVDADIFHPGISPSIPRDKFNFLYCAIPHVRKGIDLLLKAYFQNFSASDPVRLILKTSRRSSPPQSFVIDIDKTIQEIKSMFQNKDLPELMVVDQVYYNLASLYSSAHAYVAPSRSEGFGMTTLEAMACGIPVIATAYGGHLDFLNDSNAYMIAAKEVEATHQMQYWQYQRGALIGEPDVTDLGRQMRLVYENYEGTIPKIANGFETVKKYNWKDIITGLHNVMHEHLGIKPKLLPSNPPASKVSSVTTPASTISILKNTGKIDRAAARQLLSGSKTSLLTSPGTHQVVTQPNILPASPTPIKTLQQNVALPLPKRPIAPPSAATSSPGPILGPTIGSGLGGPEAVIFVALDDFNSPKYKVSRAEALLMGDNLSPILLTGSQAPNQIMTTFYENFYQIESKKWQDIKKIASLITLVVNVSEVTKLAYYLTLLAPNKVYYIVDIPLQECSIDNLKYGRIKILVNLITDNPPTFLNDERVTSIWVNAQDIPKEGLFSQSALYGELL